jgi:hypothetical protein
MENSAWLSLDSMEDSWRLSRRGTVAVNVVLLLGFYDLAEFMLLNNYINNKFGLISLDCWALMIFWLMPTYNMQSIE